MSFTDEEISEFKTEAEELLDGAEKSLLALDKGGVFGCHYDSIFRAFHSIKGAAGMMEMPLLQNHLHQLENLLTEQKPKASLSKAYIDFFLQGSDAARNLLNGNTIEFDYNVKDATNPSESANSDLSAGKQGDSKEASPAPVEDKQSVAKIRGRIIVVDDETEIVSALTAILSNADLEAIGTSKPEEVLALIEKHQPDAVLTDIAMPNMNGMQLLEIIANKYPDLPVIFISGHVTKESLIEAIECGVYAVLEKPFNSKHLLACCLNAIQKFQLSKILNSSVNLLMYQFSDLDDFLKSKGKDDIRTLIGNEINTLLEQRRKLRRIITKKTD
jgi:DNA-binding response OmpR family regulator/HPt (histidine-containing phosphotransfer) domain-containing protein